MNFKNIFTKYEDNYGIFLKNYLPIMSVSNEWNLCNENLIGVTNFYFFFTFTLLLFCLTSLINIYLYIRDFEYFQFDNESYDHWYN